MDSYTLAWGAWLAAFAAIEGRALMRKQPGDTLSEHVWRWFGVAQRDPMPSGWTRVRRFSLLAGCVWLAAHFLTGGWV
ncbi:hypothetical protein PV729_04160 [Streptomyces europaeiscabiei]|uniref:Integral membrane protein n=1 Tax=Streptomyces europaeiscabiei TaxID=146819 RepID=A0ABU4N678_9ACTN|nr:hypothetical protein [Streptomyces europaeiscabiei]MDX3550971.1 hypothetical protein [Streptomyces europaeiscabiei]MDX3698469.1 hypothetical protein [Streptomyces europaeiscabiei]